ncbi:hypothetical protein HY030_03245 [Candidatus Gottesmanbacteria bacterium]|nr:hypothetical protein [Candidatus Gottesmanbacteria bacterium]
MLPTKLAVAVVVVGALTLGGLTGYFLAQSTGGKQTASNKQTQGEKGQLGKSVVVGSTDTKTFKDCAKGELAKNDGKITDEGSHKLVREGGDSQTVYLTSSVVDLNPFVGKKLEVCGETFKAQKAGWLMDVGRVKVQ